MAFQAPKASAAPPETPPEALDTPEAVRAYLLEAFKPDLLTQMANMAAQCVQRISQREAYFRERNLKRRILKECEKQFAEVPDVMHHPRFDRLIDWAIDQQPLLQLGQTGQLMTPEMYEMEQLTLAMAGEEKGQHILPDFVVEYAISQKKGISEEQIAAVHTCTLSPRTVSVVEGTAGAGKSFTMQAVKEAYQARGYDVLGVALSHNAAKVLSDSIGIKKGQAIEGFIRKMAKARQSGTEFFAGKTLIIVDEAGMVGTRHMFHILNEARLSKHQHKIVLTGDSLQVNPVEAGNILEAIVETHGTTRIDTIRRQKQESHRMAVKRFSQQKAGAALYPFVQQERVHWCANQDVLFNKVVQDYLSYRLQNPNKSVLILALRNEDVAKFNQRVRQAFRKLGKIGAFEVETNVTDGNNQWQAKFSVGDEVVLRSNDADLIVYEADPTKSPVDEREWVPKGVGVYNRNSGKIIGIRKAKKPLGSWDFVVEVGTGPDAFRAIINTDRFKHPEKQGLPMVHNFATTIYGSQGQTVNKVLMMNSSQMQFRLAYVGMSRHTEDVDLYLDETAIHETLNKARGEEKSLQERLAIERGDEVSQIKLGRYSRAAMLQTVALDFAKDAQNMTATVYERRHRLGLLTNNFDRASVITAVEPASATDPVVDFIPELNIRQPVIDLEQLMGLPDPIVETEMVRPSQAEDARYENPGNLERPASATLPNGRARRASVNPSAPAPTPPPAAKPASESSLFAKPMAWLRGIGQVTGDEVPLAAPPASGHKARREDDVVVPAFASAEEAQAVQMLKQRTQKERPIIPDAEATFSIGYATQPSPIPLDQIPFHPLPPSMGHVDEQGVLRFDNVPQTKNTQAGPSDAFLLKARGVCWDIGRGGEPRVVVMEHRRSKPGEPPKLPVAHRYRLDGKCVVGDGYPPIILNGQGNAQSPIYIVPGVREWFLMAEHMRLRHADDPVKIPHMIWAAEDVDWRHVAEGLRGKNVVIVRSKTDESQIAWARSLQQLLSDPEHMHEHTIATTVRPPLPAFTPEPTPAPEAPPAPAPEAPVAPPAPEEPVVQPTIRIRKRM